MEHLKAVDRYRSFITPNQIRTYYENSEVLKIEDIGKMILAAEESCISNISIEFADFLLNDYEIDFRDDSKWNEDYCCWRLSGTEQKYTSEELFNEFIKIKNGNKIK